MLEEKKVYQKWRMPLMDSSSKMKCRKKKKKRIAKICGAIPKGVTQHNRNTRKRSNNEQKKKNEVIMVKKIQNWTKYTKLQIQKFRERQ